MSARHAIAPLVVAVALTACTGAPEAAEPPEPTGSPSPTVTESESPSATPTPSASASASEDDPYAAPAPEDVDVEYVQRVLEGIYSVEDRLLRLEIGHALSGATEPPDAALTMLETAFDHEQLEFKREGVAQDWEGQATPLDQYKRDPGPVSITVQEVVDTAEGCIIATFLYDTSARFDDPQDPGHLIAQLEPKPQGVDPEDINPTPWVITRQFVLDSVTGEPRCEG